MTLEIAHQIVTWKPLLGIKFGNCVPNGLFWRFILELLYIYTWLRNVVDFSPVLVKVDCKTSFIFSACIPAVLFNHHGSIGYIAYKSLGL